MVERQRQVVATHLMRDVTDASRGVVPLVVAEEAILHRRGGALYPPLGDRGESPLRRGAPYPP